MHAMLHASGLRFAYPSGGFTLRVPEWHVRPGETVALSGPSGTGKTTLLKLFAGILPSRDGGRLTIAQQDLQALSAKALRDFRRRQLGLIFQDFALLDYLSVRDNVLLPLRLAGELTPSHETRARALIESLDLRTHWQSLVGEMSQGERQRVAVARALVHEPGVVLADEPTSSVDARRRHLVMELLTRHAREKQASLIMVTHDTGLFSAVDRVVRMEEWTS